MKNKLVALLLIACAIANAQEAPISAKARHVIDSVMNAHLKRHKIVGASIAIIDNGRTVYSNGYGFSDREKAVKATGRTVYRVGSCTKSFTALSIMQLSERRKLDINRSIREYLPELKIASRFKDENPLLIKDIMCHASGLPCDVTNGFFCDAPPDIPWLISELNRQYTIAPPRYQHLYSNVGYGLLGELITRVSGYSYSDYVRRNIFNPLGMHSSFIAYDSLLAKDFSKAYFAGKPISEPMIRDQAAGLVHSSAEDMAKYVQMYLGHGAVGDSRIAAPHNIIDMQQNHIADLALKSSESAGYGLFSRPILWKQKKDSAVVTLVDHAGDTYAFHADFAYIPELNIGAVILTNTDNGGRIASAANLLKLYTKEEHDRVLRLQYTAPGDTLLPDNEKVCPESEVPGVYNINTLLIKVKDVRKFSFHQGGAKIVMRQKPAGTRYTAKAYLFGFIPFRIKDQEFEFVKRTEGVFLKVIMTRSKAQEYIALKSATRGIPEAWKTRFGSYSVSGKNYKCTNCPYMDADGLKLKLKEKDGFLTLNLDGKTPDLKKTVYLDVVDDMNCVTGGIGRGTGETVRVLENGNLYYSGFEFRQEK